MDASSKARWPPQLLLDTLAVRRCFLQGSGSSNEMSDRLRLRTPEGSASFDRRCLKVEESRLSMRRRRFGIGSRGAAAPLSEQGTIELRRCLVK